MFSDCSIPFPASALERKGRGKEPIKKVERINTSIQRNTADICLKEIP
jgi:hypothetical protein